MEEDPTLQEVSPGDLGALDLWNSSLREINPDAVPFNRFMPWRLFWRDAILRSINPSDFSYLEDPGFDTDLSRYANYQYTTLGTTFPWADEKKEAFDKVRPEWKSLFQYFEEAGGHSLQVPANTPNLLKMAYRYGCMERKARTVTYRTVMRAVDLASVT
ncbi:hypothetical protein TWF481_010695 [Arthrobotrys musiformis]|uniref:Uncharacterized protein n=1 Tax=Arthrobotrys musiformis TaxID=47236 RepID=A0AAV9W1I7_9PEZI